MSGEVDLEALSEGPRDLYRKLHETIQKSPMICRYHFNTAIASIME